jgi:hypothetical protein
LPLSRLFPLLLFLLVQASVGEDAEFLALGERCKVMALKALQARGRFDKAADQTDKAFYKAKAERWSCDGYMGSGAIAPVPGVPNAWQVYAVDAAPLWFELRLGKDRPDPLPAKWIRLKAKSREQAKKEALALDRQLDRDFWGQGQAMQRAV